MEIEENCNALGSLFQSVVGSMKDSWPAFEELSTRTAKLHSTLRTTLVAVNGFLEAFQKVADIATNSHGATKDTGKALTRLCLRHRTIEAKLKAFTSSLLDGLAAPLQDKVEEWKKNVVCLDKEHGRDTKKARQEIKKASSDTVRLQKKAKKGKGDAKERLEQAMHGVSSRFSVLEEVEKRYVRKSLVEERQHFCEYITYIKPMVDTEIAMISEVTHLQEIMDILCSQAADPDNLPESSEQAILDVKGTDLKRAYQPTPPDSPLRSRASSMASMSSLASVPESTSSDHSMPSAIVHKRMAAVAAGARPVSELASVPLRKGSSSGGVNQNPLHGSVAGTSGTAYFNYDSTSLQGGDSGYLSQQSSDRPHTISTAATAAHHRARPGLGRDTFDPLPAGGGHYHVPSSVMSSQGSQLEAHPMGSLDPRQLMPPPNAVPVRSRNPPPSSSKDVRSSLGPISRGPKLKAVRTPSIPFMETEPVYMNAAELAQRIKERRREEDRMSLRSNDSHESLTLCEHRQPPSIGRAGSVGSMGRRSSVSSPLEDPTRGEGMSFDAQPASARVETRAPVQPPNRSSVSTSSLHSSDGVFDESKPVELRSAEPRPVLESIDLSELPPPPPPDSFLSDVTEEGPLDMNGGEAFVLPPPPPASYANPSDSADSGGMSLPPPPLPAPAKSSVPKPKQSTYAEDVAAQDLADAIKELESATVSLTMVTDGASLGPPANRLSGIDSLPSTRNSLTGSSGYGTTNSLSSTSDENHSNTGSLLPGAGASTAPASGPPQDQQPELPVKSADRVGQGSELLSAASSGAMGGKPKDVITRMKTSKPPPPVRRSSSMSAHSSMEDDPLVTAGPTSTPQAPPSASGNPSFVAAKPPPIASKPDKASLLNRSRSSAANGEHLRRPSGHGEPVRKTSAESPKPSGPGTAPKKSSGLRPPQQLQQSKLKAPGAALPGGPRPKLSSNSPPAVASKPSLTQPGGPAPWDRAPSSRLPTAQAQAVGPAGTHQPLSTIQSKKAGFLTQLNARLGGSQDTQVPQPMVIRTGNGDSVRQKIAAQVKPSPSGSRDNLLSEIQNGRSLKKTSTNDRSAPKLR